MMWARLFLAVALLAAFGPQAGATDGARVVVQQGTASIYADRLQGHPTASGALHDQDDFTAASRLLPLGTRATVTNLATGQAVEVEIIDRGPFVRGRIIDLSRRAAAEIGFDRQQGVTRVRVQADPRHQITPEMEDKIARLAAARASSQAPTGARLK